MRHGLAGADKPGAELDARRSHPEVAGDRLAATDAAGNEDRNAIDMGEGLLGQNARRHGTDVTARLHPLDHDPIDSAAHQAPRDGQGRSKGKDTHSGLPDTPDRGCLGKSSRQHDVGDGAGNADIDQPVEVRVHDNEVDAERTIGEAPAWR